MAGYFQAWVGWAIASVAVNAAAPQQAVVVRQALSHASTNGGSSSVSADGRFVAVVSLARLADADTNTLQDIYVFDRQTGALTLESKTPSGESANGSSAHPDLSADGHYLVFDSSADNLTAAPDRNELEDVFLRDRLTNTTRRLSIGKNGEEPNGRSQAPVISDDGRIVAFVSSATNLVAERDENGGVADVYVVRVDTGEIARVGLNAQGKQFATSHSPSLSGNGAFVAFTAREPKPANIDAATRPALSAVAVYVRDLTSKVTTCVSCGRKSGEECQPGFDPDISGDGRIVTFVTQSATREARMDIAVHDMSTGATTVITQHANARSASPRISGNGRFVAFQSWASDLRCTKRCQASDLDNNVLPDIYLFDRETTQFRRVSGEQHVWWAPSASPSVDAEGRIVTFSSRQPFGPEDVTVDFDLYVCEPACQ